MIHYHGLPITPETAAARALTGGHAFISFAEQRNLGLIAEVCQSFALDNGAFSAWRGGAPITDWAPFYAWAASCRQIPGCDFAVIPDVIDGDEAENDALVEEWPLPRWYGAPVWHMHESLERLNRLAQQWPRVCLGSSGSFATIGTASWWVQMGKAMRVLCNDDGQPRCRLHGLRMLDPAIFQHLPLSSADSTNIARNVGSEGRWLGAYAPPTKEARAEVLRARIENLNGSPVWRFIVPDVAEQGALL